MEQTALNRKLFKELRKQRGLSIAELASLMDCSPALISNVENSDKRSLSLEKFKSACMALGVSSDVLLGLNNNDCVYQNAYRRARNEVSRKLKMASEQLCVTN